LLAKWSAGRGAAPATSPARAIPRWTAGTPAPLSPGQERIWFIESLFPGTQLYHLPFQVFFSGSLSVAVFERSCRELAVRHEILRARFDLVDGVVRQQIGPQPSNPLPLVDLGGLPERIRAREVARLRRDEPSRRFDLSSGPLYRFVLVREAPDRHLWLATIHHIVADGWSLVVLAHDHRVLYDCLLFGTPPALAPLRCQYVDYAAWLVRQIDKGDLRRELEHWTSLLGDGAGETLELPFDRPRSALGSVAGDRFAFSIPPDVSRELRAFSQHNGVTLFVTLLAVLNVLLHRYSGSGTIRVGTFVSDRPLEEVEGLMGLFLNMLVVRTDLGDDPSFSELVRRTKGIAVEAFENQRVPFERIVGELNPERQLNRAPLCQVMFNFRSALATMQPPIGLVADVHDVRSGATQFDLSLELVDLQRHDASRTDLEAWLVYNRDLFDRETAEAIAVSYLSLLEALLANPERHISQVSLRSERASKALPDPTQPWAPRPARNLIELLHDGRERDEDAVALADSRVAWSYRQLDEASDRVCTALCARGIGPDRIVAIHGSRSAGLVAALIGVLKAGAATLLLDPSQPGPWLAGLAARARPAGWIAVGPAEVAPELSALLAEPLLRSELTSGSLGAPAPAGEKRRLAIDPVQSAYVIPTSGTRGRPRLVIGSHEPIAAFVDWYVRRLELGSNDRFALASGLMYDPLQRDLWTPLSIGASLHIPDETTLRDPKLFRSWLHEEKITVLHATPALLDLLLEGFDHTDRPLEALRYGVIGGDVLTWRKLRRFARLAPGARFVNAYGTSETPQIAAYTLVDADAPAAGSAGSVPIGRGREGVDLVLLNPRGDLCGVGEPGEILVRSEYLADAYLDDEMSTRERFVRNPWGCASRDRMHRTGDRGRYRRDGSVVLLGRSDDQEKIRGVRVAPAEVAGVLAQHALVSEAYVLGCTSPRHERALVAYWKPQGDAVVESAELRRFLAARLPDAMVPSAFVKLDVVPLGAGGKLDRSALPLPNWSDGARPAAQPPETEMERSLAAIWKEVLGVATIARHDDFFDLGGHSLMAIRVIARLRDDLGIGVGLRALFEHSTLAEFARQLENGPGRGSDAPTDGLAGVGADAREAWAEELSERELDAVIAGFEGDPDDEA
jgi:amino acid adenylation domain-containing protein